CPAREMVRCAQSRDRGGLRSSRTDRGAQVLPPAGATEHYINGGDCAIGCRIPLRTKRKRLYWRPERRNRISLGGGSRSTTRLGARSGQPPMSGGVRRWSSCRTGGEDGNYKNSSCVHEWRRFGLVSSLNRPGANVTGVSILLREVGAKRMELLREL